MLIWTGPTSFKIVIDQPGDYRITYRELVKLIGRKALELTKNIGPYILSSHTAVYYRNDGTYWVIFE